MRELFLLMYFSCMGLLSAGQNAGFKVMTFNIRYDNPVDGIYSWQNRLPLVKIILIQEHPDVIGFQEVLKNQVDGLQEFLPEFSWSGVGRDDGKEKGEYSVIFYRTIRFEKVDGSTFWLSETPDIPGSRSWNAACTRIVTWVKLKDKKSHRFFFIFNTHFDHASQTAREESAKLLRKKISEIAGNTNAIITGDFNDTLTSNPIRTLTSGDGAPVNTRNVSSSPPEGPDYSFAGFPFNPEKGNTIDFIFMKSNESIKVLSHHTVTYHKEDKYPSDHLPVCAEFEFPIR